MSCLADQNIFATLLDDSFTFVAGWCRIIACVTKETKSLVKFIREPALKSVFWAPTFVPGFEYVPLLVCEKSYCQFANQAEEGKLKHFLTSNPLRLM